MGFNISQVMKALVGDSQPGDAKALELKVGQLVKGMVLQITDDNEALINIGGTLIKAKLETPLQPGQVTTLQVQPESLSGTIWLKALQQNETPLTEEFVKQFLKDFGQKDVAAAKQFLQVLAQSEQLFNKETLSQVAKIVEAMPKGTDLSKVAEAATIAVNRGLPITPETVLSIKEAISGKPLPDTAGDLVRMAQTLLKEGTQVPESLQKPLQSLISLVNSMKQTIEQGLDLPVEISPDAEPELAHEAPQSVKASAVNSNQAEGKLTADKTIVLGNQTNIEQEITEPAKSVLLSTAQTKEPAEIGKAPTVSLNQAVVAGKESSEAPKASSAPLEKGTTADKSPVTSEMKASDKSESNWIGRLLKMVGVDHENQISKLPLTTTVNNSELKLPEMAGGHANRTEQLLAGAPNDLKGAAVTESLKNVLLQIATSDDAPAALKETASQALQNISGQQLLMTSDRNAVLTNMTLFIPMFNASGEQTAAVHLQSRKGKRGEVDTSNCRLLFDLKMKTIGETLVDVQVVNRIVSLHVHNGHPAMPPLLDSFRNEIVEGLNKIGYQFISLKCSQFPEISASTEPASASTTTQKSTRFLNSLYEMKPYKGVDFRA